MESQENSSDSEEKIQIKTEPREEDIKGYAENTMNELLAIYGYEKVDEGLTKELHLNRFSYKDDEREMEDSQDRLVIKQEVDDESYDLKPQLSDPDASDAEMADLRGTDPDLEGPDGQLCAYRLTDSQLVGYRLGGPSSPAEDHLNSSGTSAGVFTSAECSDGENSGSGYDIVCAWCQRFGFKRYTLNTTTESKAFCSEKCFAACRRAYFRRNKVCDWCRHIRHTKEYIDFQDGKRKLQFCSEKCLHQYKMDLFCQETQTLGSSTDANTAAADSESAGDQSSTGAPSSLEENEKAESGPVAATMTASSAPTTSSSSQSSQALRNGVHQAAGGPQPSAAAAAAKSKQLAKTVFGSQQVPIAPKVALVTASQATVGTTTLVGAVPAAAAAAPAPVATVTLPSVVPAAIPPAAQVTPATTAASQVLGLQTILPPTVAGSQVVGRTPVVVRGTHWPPVVQQIPGYVIPGPQQQQQQQQPSHQAAVQHPRRILPAPQSSKAAEPAGQSAAAAKAPDTSAPAFKKCSPSAAKSTESRESTTSGLSHLLPPVTVMVPQPVFIPIPYPIPVPVPVPEDTFHAMWEAFTSRQPGSHEGDRPGSATADHPRFSTEALDFMSRRYAGSELHESLADVHGETDPDCAPGSSPQRIVTCSKRQHHRLVAPERDQPSCPIINEPACAAEDTRQNPWQPPYRFKTLQRSASMDLSLARPAEEVGPRSLQKTTAAGRSETEYRPHQDGYLSPGMAVHPSGESSAKVRQVLRCHLTKRHSQSALNLNEVGRLPAPQDDLRRCQSLSRLRFLEPSHMERLPELADAQSPSSRCSSASASSPSAASPSAQRDGPSLPGQEEIGAEDDEGESSPRPTHPQDRGAESASDNDDDDAAEPETKRRRPNHT